MKNHFVSKMGESVVKKSNFIILAPGNAL